MTKTNGEHGEILRELHTLSLQLAVMKERQALNHQDNKTDIGVSYEKLEAVEKRVGLLPCSIHVEKFTQYDNTRRLLVGTIFSVVVLLVGFAVAWGAIQTRVNDHIKNTDKVLEKCCV